MEELEALKNKKNELSSEDEDLEVGLDNNLYQNLRERKHTAGVNLSDRIQPYFVNKTEDAEIDQ